MKFKPGDKVRLITPEDIDIKRGYIKDNIYTLDTFDHYWPGANSNVWSTVENKKSSLYERDFILVEESKILMPQLKKSDASGWGF